MKITYSALLSLTVFLLLTTCSLMAQDTGTVADGQDQTETAVQESTGTETAETDGQTEADENAAIDDAIEKTGTEHADASENNESDSNKEENVPADNSEADGKTPENEPETDLNGELEKLAADAIAEQIKENSAEELINLATELKLSAESLIDLTKIITLCKEAEKKGLSEEDAEYCRQLRVSTQLQRGLAVSQILLEMDMPNNELMPRILKSLKKQAIDDIETSLEDTPGIAVAYLAIGRLHLLPDGDEELARKALDQAIEFAGEEQNVLTEALKYRAGLEKDDEKVTQLLQKALEMDPENEQLHEQLAGHWQKIKNFEGALAEIDKAIELDPENKEFKKVKAYLLIDLQKNEEAENLFKEVVDINSEELMDQIEWGQFLATLGKFDESIEHFTKLIDKYGDVPGFHYFRALGYLEKKDYKSALSDVNQVLRKDSDMIQAIQLKGVIYLQMEKYDDAIRLFTTLKKRNPKDMVPITQIAYAQAKKGDFNAAMTTLEKGLEKNPNNVELLRSRGDIEMMYGLGQKSKETYLQIIAITPHDPGVLNNYSWLLSTSPDDSLRDGQKALELAKEAAERSYYGESYILSTLAAAYAELGQFDLAREWSAKAVALAEKERHERLDDLKKELESYQKNEPWREIPEKSLNGNAEKAAEPQTESGSEPVNVPDSASGTDTTPPVTE